MKKKNKKKTKTFSVDASKGVLALWAGIHERDLTRLFVHFSERWSTHHRLLHTAIVCYQGNTFRAKVQVSPVGITVFPTFRIYWKHPLPVNIAVDLNKLEIQDKTVSLLSKNT